MSSTLFSSPDPLFAGIAEFGAEAVSRNLDIITEREQAALRAATVLVAGCGSVGGAVVEPLARLGVTRFRLADPDRFDVSNLNRQACVVEDVDKPKSEVLARRVLAINPMAEARTYPGGLTLENLDEALDGAHIAFDAIDPAMSGWVKYQLHAGAARRRIPVVAGVDWGGKPAVFVFDYRRNPSPFHGKATAEAHRDGRLWESVRWFGRTHFPSDYLPVMADRLANGGTWPQVSYCVMGLGALGSRVVLDLLMNRRVRPVVTVDLHAAAMPRSVALAHRARMPLELARTLLTIRRVTRNGMRPVPERRSERPLPPLLVTALEGARLAPSAYNAQPWRFDIRDDRTVHLALEAGRWPAADPDRRGWAESLGCALGAMSYLAQGEWESHTAERAGEDWFAGRFRVDRLRHDVLTRQGVLGVRATHRADMLRTPIDRTTAQQLEALCAKREVTVETVTGRGIARLPALADYDNASSIPLRQLDELWAWLRKRDSTGTGRRSFGEPHHLLGVSGVTGRLVSALAGVPTPARATFRLMAEAIAQERARRLRNCGAVLVLRGPRSTVSDRISAGETMMRLWLVLVENGYVAQPLHGELGGFEAAPSGDAVLAVLRVGKSATPQAVTVSRTPLDASVRWID